jgi:hypothetical protein
MKDEKDMKKCGLTCWSHRSVVGGIFIILATILTLLTLNGFGILGMFAVGCMLCCHRKSTCGCACHAGCSDEHACCDVTPKKSADKKPKHDV